MKEMIMRAAKTIQSVHPGFILLEEFLIPMEISQYRLAKTAITHKALLKEVSPWKYHDKGNRHISL
jgi:hypothetical protein